MKKSTAFFIGAAAVTSLGILREITRDKTFDEHSKFLTHCAIALDENNDIGDFHFDVANKIWYKPNRLIVEFDINTPVSMIERLCKSYNLDVINYHIYDDASTVFLFEYKDGDGDFERLVKLCINLMSAFEEVLDADLEIVSRKAHRQFVRNFVCEEIDKQLSEELFDDEEDDKYLSEEHGDFFDAKTFKKDTSKKIPIK